MKKLPIGIQTFKDIRSDDYIYIDKTKIALDLIESGRYYFLSRPRRFGKSLFLDTLKNIFEAKKELFKDLYIYDKYDWSKKYPVIYISFAEGVLKDSDKFNEKVTQIFKENQKRLNVECEKSKSLNICFKDLIVKAYEKYNQKVVILVDEYDKPILDNITNIEIAKQMREELKNIYSVVKGADEYVEFAFLTGVSKFSKVSIFSGLNNLEDITLNAKYGSICGYSGNDIETSFKELLNGVDLKELKDWYNGYNFLGENVYNPFDILLFISNGYKFRNYWFETGTPTFLIELMKKNSYFIPNLEHIKVNDSLIGSFDIENIKIETLLFQTGYLTIKDTIEQRRGLEYILSYPNKEVLLSLNDHILDYLTNQYSEKFMFQDKVYECLEKINLDKLKDILIELFASIQYNNYTNNKIYEYEGYYASVIYSYLVSLGIELIAEDVTNRNRIDLTLKLDNKVFIIEFKVIDKLKDNSKNSALEQIKENNYAQKYQSKEIYLLGIEFCKDEKNICNFEWEKS